MTLFRAIKAIEPGGRIKRKEWPPDLFVYVTKKTEEIKLQFRKGWTTFIADGLAEPDCKADDWIVMEAKKK